MRSFTTTAIVGVAALTLVLFATLAAAHCIFDSPEMQQAIENDMGKPAPTNEPEVPNNRAVTYDHIRIKFETADLSNTAKYCTAAGETKPNMQGGTLTCTADDVFTTAKRNELINQVLPHAEWILKWALKVVPLTSNLVVGSTTQCSGGFTIPSAHTTTGIADIDYVLYVAAAPTVSGNVAWAGGCQSTSGSPKRIIVGRANFGPKYLQSSTFPLDKVKATGVHEILHAMGFAWSSFTAAGIWSSHTVRGITKNFIKSATARQAARKYLSCDTLHGVELENEGGSGSANSHVDRRLYKDDVMAATSGWSLSTVTLSIMEGLGVYQVNYTSAEAMVTGWKLGCDYNEKSCTTTAGGKGVVWCSTNNAIDCTSDFRGYGPCKTTSLLFTDSCPYVNAYSNRNCYDTTQADSANDGNKYGATSRCVKVSNGFKKSGGSAPSGEFRCMRARCINGVVSMGYDGSIWATCTSDGGAISLSGYDGTITCPASLARFCQGTKFYENQVNFFGPLPAATPVVLGKTNRASDWMYTTKSILVITGTGWSTLVKDHYNDLVVKMGLDVASWLGLEQQQVWVFEVVLFQSLVKFVVNINAPNYTTPQVQAKWTQAMNEGGRNWMTRSATLYIQSANVADTPAMGSASSESKPENLCTTYMPSMEDTDTCNGMIAGMVFAVVAFLSFIVITTWCCCCRYIPPPPQSAWKYEAGGEKKA